MAPHHLHGHRPARHWQPAGWWAAAALVCSMGVGTLWGMLSSSSNVTAALAGLAAGAVPGAVAVWLLRSHQGVVTGADRATLVRVVLTGILSAALVLVIAEDVAARSWLLASLAGAALALDGVDGWLARRTHTASRQGATLDSEADAALLLVLTGLAAATLGWWVLLIGLMRYAFLAASWATAALQGPLPQNRARRIIGLSQGLAMLAVLTPAVPVVAAWIVACAALLALSFSFARDVLGHLHRHRRVGSRKAAPQWLSQRRQADHRAREQARDLVDTLNAHLRPAVAADHLVTVVDVGAGTGSNGAWLAPRLHGTQQWILVDQDPKVLSAADQPENLHGAQQATRVVATVTELPTVIGELNLGQGPLIITCSALLDVLSSEEAEALSEVICGTAGGHVTAALLSLSVTGEVHFTPAHRHDQALTAAFNAHQRRAGLLGPEAVAAIDAMLQRRGGVTTVRRTDWQLGATEASMLRRFITERADAAASNDPRLAAAASTWTSARLDQLAAGALHLQVAHLDVLCIPAAPRAARSSHPE